MLEVNSNCPLSDRFVNILSFLKCFSLCKLKNCFIVFMFNFSIVRNAC